MYMYRIVFFGLFTECLVQHFKVLHQHKSLPSALQLFLSFQYYTRQEIIVVHDNMMNRYHITCGIFQKSVAIEEDSIYIQNFDA